MVACVLITHVNLGSGLRNAIEKMLGKQKGFKVLSNAKLSSDKLLIKLEDFLVNKNFKNGCVIFVDLWGGSCWKVAKEILSRNQNKKMALISGANLPMLLQFFSKRNSLSYNELLTKLSETGKKSITIELL